MKKNLTALTFLLQSIKPFKFYVALHLFVVLYNAIDLSLWPYISKLLVDKLTLTPHEQAFSEAWPLGLLLIFFTFLPGIIWRLSDYAWMQLTPLMKKKITNDAMNYTLQHSHNFFQNNFSGSLANKVRDLAGSTPPILARILYSFINVILSLIIAFFTLFYIHKFFAYALIIWAALFILLALRIAKITTPMSISVSDQQTKIMGNLVDVLGNVVNVRFFTRSRHEINRINTFQDDYTKLSKRRNIVLIKFHLLSAFSFSIYYAVGIFALIWFYSNGQVTLGDFLLLFTINNWIIHLMWMSANELNSFLEDVGTVNQALSVINQPLQIVDSRGAKALRVERGEIVFENIYFHYYQDLAPLFSNKNLTIKAGQKVGLVGHSGGGKTTFVNLILRLFDVSSGRILIDGQDIAKVTQESLRNSIGVIPQDPSLFHRTLLENISYGNEGDIIAAAKKSHCHEFIENLPQGYESLVGERGVKLSGGQRQRIAIARAFLKNAPILILDEATSQLDSITENLIQDSLTNLMQNKTTIIIAHRLSTLKHMDRILVFDKGKIIEDGSHQELIDLNGSYKKLWDSQVGGFLIENIIENND